MNIILYCIYDRLAGTFSEPFAALSDDLAVRRFNYVMQHSAMVAPDCDLYRVAGMSLETGEVSPCKPDFVHRYEVKQNG